LNLNLKDNIYGQCIWIYFIDKIYGEVYGWVSWIKLNTIDYGYDEGDGLKLISNKIINLS